MTTKGAWLNLGCGDDFKEGFINVDRTIQLDKITPGIIVLQADLSVEPWPWETSAIDFILATDIIEHLPDKIRTMNEAWRVLKPFGVLKIEVPTTDGPGAWQDPTHVSFWNRNSFWYYEHGNPYRERFAGTYGIKARFRAVHHEFTNTQDGPRLMILLEAVK